MNRPPSLAPTVALVLAAGLATSAPAATITVSPGGPLTIQAAVDQAAPGDVVELLDGTYTGDGNRDILFHGKAITVRSRSGDPTLCILDVEGSAAANHRGFEFADYEELDSVVEGLTITGGYATWGGGINCWGGGATVRNCRFIANHATSEGGGLAASEATRIVDCWFEDNSATGSGGVSVHDTYGDLVTLERCTFARNYAQLYGGGFRN